MRKILIVGLLATFSHISNAQIGTEIIPNNTDTTSVSTKTETKLNKLENDVLALKRDNDSLKKQINQIKSSWPNTKRKISVSRVGSKQIVVE